LAARRRLVVALTARRRAAGVVALRAVRLVVLVERVVERGGFERAVSPASRGVSHGRVR